MAKAEQQQQAQQAQQAQLAATQSAAAAAQAAADAAQATADQQKQQQQQQPAQPPQQVSILDVRVNYLSCPIIDLSCKHVKQGRKHPFNTCMQNYQDIHENKYNRLYL